MSPDYLSTCTQEMSPAEKGPQVLLTHMDDTIMKAEVTGYISQRRAVRSLEGKEKKTEQQQKPEIQNNAPVMTPGVPRGFRTALPPAQLLFCSSERQGSS